MIPAYLPNHDRIEPSAGLCLMLCGLACIGMPVVMEVSDVATALSLLQLVSSARAHSFSGADAAKEHLSKLSNQRGLADAPMGH
jgi:hypothetical protein